MSMCSRIHCCCCFWASRPYCRIHCIYHPDSVASYFSSEMNYQIVDNFKSEKMGGSYSGLDEFSACRREKKSFVWLLSSAELNPPWYEFVAGSS
jgi:hypothetical protein